MLNFIIISFYTENKLTELSRWKTRFSLKTENVHPRWSVEDLWDLIQIIYNAAYNLIMTLIFDLYTYNSTRCIYRVLVPITWTRAWSLLHLTTNQSHETIYIFPLYFIWFFIYFTVYVNLYGMQLYAHFTINYELQYGMATEKNFT